MNTYKLCLIGPSAVGKTSLIRQFVEGIFSEKYLTSIGVKIDKKQVSTESGDVLFLIWDIEGTDKFSGFNPRYLNGASAYIVVADQTQPSSVEDAIAIYQQAIAASNADVYLAINKNDLPPQVSEQQLECLTSLKFQRVISTSAKTGENVSSLFTDIASSLLAKKL